jgi:hypothetical protein
MVVVTMSPEQVRTVAQVYRLLRAGDCADPVVLTQHLKIVDRFLAAHARGKLRVAPSVKLPMSTVLMMLEVVKIRIEDRLCSETAPYSAKDTILHRVRNLIHRL